MPIMENKKTKVVCCGAKWRESEVLGRVYGRISTFNRRKRSINHTG